MAVKRATRKGASQKKRFTTPVRIYVYWHPSFKDGGRLARQIYHWFRLPSGAGIPVYLRCKLEGENIKKWKRYERSCKHDLVLVLVDAHMVASLDWRRYFQDLVSRSKQGRRGGAKIHIRPLAMDDTAYQMPDAFSSLNYIRRSGGSDPDNEVLMTRITESLCLILRQENLEEENSRSYSVRPIKIFLSHAKADGTDIPQQIKRFIQTETQCEVFFDENDIAYGRDFGDVIKQALGEDSAGLLVVQGDHYADRPWCRKEIRDFLSPTRTGSDDDLSFLIMPSVVVSALSGDKSARTIPELGYSPLIHSTERNLRQIVVMMLREILFANFYHMLARESAQYHKGREGVNIYVNRPPDPIMIERICSEWKVSSKGAFTLHHPGHGLTEVEADGMRSLFPEIRFLAYGANESGSDNKIYSESEKMQSKVLAVSISGSQDSIDVGLIDEHAVELLRRVLQPLFRKGISLLYGGRLPQFRESRRPWDDEVNFSEVFFEMLLSEQRVTLSGESVDERDLGRLFNLSAWPYSKRFKVEDEAMMINTCTLLLRSQKDAGLEERDWFAEEEEEQAEKGDEPSDELQIKVKKSRNTAICLSGMRQSACQLIKAPTPSDDKFEFLPFAHVMIGGKTKGYDGSVPGIWEEVYCALEYERPCFLVGAFQGAAGQLANWFLSGPSKRPKELSVKYQIRQNKNPIIAEHVQDELNQRGAWVSAEDILDGLWGQIQRAREKDVGLARVFKNGLSDEDNTELLKATSFYSISRLIEKGLESLD